MLLLIFVFGVAVDVDAVATISFACNLLLTNAAATMTQTIESKQ